MKIAKCQFLKDMHIIVTLQVIYAHSSVLSKKIKIGHDLIVGSLSEIRNNTEVLN